VLVLEAVNVLVLEAVIVLVLETVILIVHVIGNEAVAVRSASG
jgi:hypothetical protein